MFCVVFVFVLVGFLCVWGYGVVVLLWSLVGWGVVVVGLSCCYWCGGGGGGGSEIVLDFGLRRGFVWVVMCVGVVEECIWVILCWVVELWWNLNCVIGLECCLGLIDFCWCGLLEFVVCRLSLLYCFFDLIF